MPAKSEPGRVSLPPADSPCEDPPAGARCRQRDPNDWGLPKGEKLVESGLPWELLASRWLAAPGGHGPAGSRWTRPPSRSRTRRR